MFIGGIKATLKVIIESDQRREKLAYKAKYLRDGLTRQGIEFASESQIVSLEGGREEITEKIRDEFESRNIFGSVFCAPATPKNRSLVRFSINSEISMYDLNKILIACQNFYGSLRTVPQLKLVS